MNDHVHEILSDWNRERPDLDTSSLEVVARILRAAHLLRRRLDEEASRYGLSHKGDLDALSALRRTGAPHELTPTELSHRLQLTSGGMTNRLDRLERAGWVARRPDPGDRRGTLVRLTPDGLRLVDEAFFASLGAQDEVLATLDEQQKADLSDALEHLLVSLGDTILAP